MYMKLSKAQTGMKVLGIFHYILALLLLAMIALLLVAGVRVLGASIHASGSPDLAFLDEYDDQFTGITGIVILVLQFFTELFTGWSCRRRAKHPDKMLLTLILSGGNVLFSLFSLFSSGLANVEWAGFLYSLTLNVITFMLALWIKRAYDRHRREMA